MNYYGKIWKYLKKKKGQRLKVTKSSLFFVILLLFITWSSNIGKKRQQETIYQSPPVPSVCSDRKSRWFAKYGNHLKDKCKRERRKICLPYTTYTPNLEWFTKHYHLEAPGLSYREFLLLNYALSFFNEFILKILIEMKTGLPFSYFYLVCRQVKEK